MQSVKIRRERNSRVSEAKPKEREGGSEAIRKKKVLNFNSYLLEIPSYRVFF